MTTRKQRIQYLKKLCPTFDAVAKPSILAKVPISDVVVGIDIHTSLQFVKVLCVVQPLYLPRDYLAPVQNMLPLKISGCNRSEILPHINRNIWDMDSDEQFSRLAVIINTELLPQFDIWNTASGLEQFFVEQDELSRDLHVLEGLGYTRLILRQADKAIECFEKVDWLCSRPSEYVREYGHPQWIRDIMDRCALMKKYAAELDWISIDQQLEAWRQFTVQKNRIAPKHLISARI